VAEREGFEPPIGLHLCRISSAVHSTTLPPLRRRRCRAKGRGRGRVIGEDGRADKARDKISDKGGGWQEKEWDRQTRYKLAVPCRLVAMLARKKRGFAGKAETAEPTLAGAGAPATRSRS
jgi:hypothetical protein